jgi:RNA polymerase sigma-B factor
MLLDAMVRLPMRTRQQDADTEYEHLTPLFWQLADPATPEHSRRRLRDTLVTGHLPLAAHIAQRFAHRGQPVEDLEQVARIGLIHAVDRFDPTRGYRFLAFAVPTITGEVKRYFRDATWSVHVPRFLQERSAAIATAISELSQELNGAPRPGQIADRLGIPVEEVYEGLQAALAYQPESLDSPDAGGPRPATVDPCLAEADTGLDLVENRETLYQALADLSDRDSAIVIMRFFGGMTQTQIAERVGLSQMHVSRLLSGSLARLREAFVEPSG